MAGREQHWLAALVAAAAQSLVYSYHTHQDPVLSGTPFGAHPKLVFC